MLFAPLFSWLTRRAAGTGFTYIGVGLGIVLLAFSLLIRGKPEEKGLLGSVTREPRHLAALARSGRAP